MYRIQALSRLTGLSPPLIRAWERRFGVLEPARTPSGYRLYTDDDVHLLRGLRRLVETGMSIGQAARLDRGTLISEGRRAAPQDPSPPGRGVLAQDESSLAHAQRIEQLIAAFAAFDRERAEGLLSAPLALLPPGLLIRHLLLPLMREIGERWHRGELTVSQEHFGSHIIRSKLLGLLSLSQKGGGKHRIVLACPEGEPHEMGLLMFAVEASLVGLQPIYLGPSVPLDDLLKTVSQVRPELLGLSFPQKLEKEALAARLFEVRGALPRGLRVLVGGQGAEALPAVVAACGCLLPPRPGDLGELLLSGI